MKRGKGMRTRNTRRVAALAAAVLGAGLALASCANDDDGGGSAGGTWPGADKSECKDLSQLADYGDLSGREVSVYTSIVAPEDQSQKDSYKLFTTCTGASVKYEGLQGVRGPAARACPGRQPA
jgi:alpha-glucoside transport system substrate-binding protein